MRPIRDPEGAELSHLLAACNLAGKDVLEIGCGDGRFIRQYASLPRRIIGLDPEKSDLTLAKQDDALAIPNINFADAVAEALPLASKSFDIILFACSL